MMQYRYLDNLDVHVQVAYGGTDKLDSSELCTYACTDKLDASVGVRTAAQII